MTHAAPQGLTLIIFTGECIRVSPNSNMRLKLKSHPAKVWCEVPEPTNRSTCHGRLELFPWQLLDYSPTTDRINACIQKRRDIILVLSTA